MRVGARLWFAKDILSDLEVALEDGEDEGVPEQDLKA